MGTEETPLTPEQVDRIYEESRSEYSEHDNFFGASRRGYVNAAGKYQRKINELTNENLEGVLLN